MNKVEDGFWEHLLEVRARLDSPLSFRPIPGLSQYRIVIQGVGENESVVYADFILGTDWLADNMYL
jgi:hypothetical protein